MVTTFSRRPSTTGTSCWLEDGPLHGSSRNNSPAGRQMSECRTLICRQSVRCPRFPTAQGSKMWQSPVPIGSQQQPDGHTVAVATSHQQQRKESVLAHAEGCGPRWAMALEVGRCSGAPEKLPPPRRAGSYLRCETLAQKRPSTSFAAYAHNDVPKKPASTEEQPP